MDRDAVNSSMISSIGYDRSTGIVEIEFRSSGQIWQYMNVPEIIYNEVRYADSIGKSFNALIKNQYQGIRVG